MPAYTVLAQTPTSRATVDLTLEEFVKRVVERNESIQVKSWKWSSISGG